MAGRREDSRGLGQEWRGWDLDDTDEHVVPTAETHAKIADAEKNHADTHHQKSKKKKNNRKKDNIAAKKLPNYNIDVTDQLVLDDEKGIVITQADIDAALQELGLEEGIIASVEVDPRDAQRSRDLATPSHERTRRPFLRRGLLERRNRVNAEASQAKRKYLDQQVLQKDEKHIVYTRRTLADVKTRMPFHSDCAYGRGSALPIGFADRALIKALQERALAGDRKARRMLRRIFGPSGDDDSDDESASAESEGEAGNSELKASEADDAFEVLDIDLPRPSGHPNSPSRAGSPHSRGGPTSPLFRSPSRLPAPVARADALTYRNDEGAKAMAVTCTPRSEYNSDDSLSDEDDPYANDEARRRRKKKKRKRSLAGSSANNTPRGGSSSNKKRHRVTMEEALSWFDDFELNSDDRFLVAAEQAGWRAWLLAEEKRELEEWLALSEDVPDPEKTAPSLLRLEMRLASSFAPLWLKDGTNDQADTEIAFPPPSPSERAVEWPSGLLKWWLSPANESRRRRFLDVEARHACVSDFVRTQAEKYEIGAVEPADADSSDRETRQRWRDFRTWYFSSDATIGRQQFLTSEVNRLAQAWETEWAKWVRFAHDRQLLDAATKALLGDKPLRWALVSAFVDDLTPVTEELVLRETWGESLTWANMSEEERRTEANVALYDQIVRSIAESENILPQAKRHARHSENHNSDVDTSPEDVDFESDPDESSDDDSFLSDGDEDDDMGPQRLNEEHMEIFMMWFPGNAQVRGNFLRREIQCAAADFVRDRPLFAGAISNNVSDPSTEKETDVLRRKMSVSAGVWSDKRMGEQRNSILSEASALQELRDALSNSGKFSVLDVDEGDGAFPSDLESATESELDEATSFKDMTNGSLEDSISCRRQDLDDAKRDLEEARRIYEEICNKCDASEAARLARVGQEFDEASDNVRRRSVRKARRVSRILDAHERLVKLEALQEECDAEVDVLRLEHRASTVAERHSIAVIRRMCELHMKTVEEAHRQAQEKLLEALRSEAAEGESTGESSKSSSGALHRNNTMLERSEKRLLATKQLAKLLGDMDNIENEIPQRVVRPSIRKRSIFESMHKVSQACVGSQRAILKLRQGTSLLKDELCKELQATAGASFVGADPISDPTMNSFKTWYSENKNVRMKYLQNRMTKLDNYRTAMLERGQGRRLIGRGIFAPEEDLEVPPVDAAAMRRIKLKRLYGLFRPEELEADDEAMRRAEMQGQEALEHELQGLMDQERRGMRKNLMREIAREVLEAFHRKHFDMEEVTTSVLGSIRFAGAVRPQAMELIDQARFTNGSGLENGDEEYERDLERYEAEREWRAKEEERRKAELRLMRVEDEELKKFYTRERRALLMAEAEAELNARALLERDEDRERREHPSGLCWRELRDLDRREMEREDYESRQRWQEIEAHEAAEALRIQEEANRQLELQLAEEEELWRNLEERRRVAQQDALVSCRELHEMAEEDLRSSYYNRIWEEERHRLARLRWMESVAFAKFDPFFKTSAGASSARLYANVKANGDGVGGGDDDDDDNKEEKELTDSNDACFVDERAEMDHAGGKRKKRDKKGREKLDAPTIPSRRDRHETFRVANRIKFLAPLSNRYQQMIGIPASCRTSDTYTRKFRSLRKLKKQQHDLHQSHYSQEEPSIDTDGSPSKPSFESAMQHEIEAELAAQRGRMRAAKRAARAAIELQRQQALEAAGKIVRPSIAVKGAPAW